MSLLNFTPSEFTFNELPADLRYSYHTEGWQIYLVPLLISVLVLIIALRSLVVMSIPILVGVLVILGPVVIIIWPGIIWWS